MITLPVSTKGGQYNIDIGAGLLSAANMPDMGGGICVITDENVWRAHGEKLLAALGDSADSGKIRPLILPVGEQNKSLAGLEKLYAAFSERGLNRSGTVIAFGGGVVGDLCGFAAATYMRGVPFVQIPTTLLAQVDSSVGGKTAINLPAGKNLAGAFYQPKHVLIDTDLLETLPPREMRCGMAEIIKYGAIRSRDLFDGLLRKDITLSDTIAACLQIKADIVSRDEFDLGERMVLNFGHTFGHAVEALGGFSRFNHGEAVAIGMVIAAYAGEALGVSPKGTADAIRDILNQYELQTACDYTVQEILPCLGHDKKRGSDGVTLVLLNGIGAAVLRKTSFTELGGILERTEALWQAK